MLPSFLIQNFRAFETLELCDLGPVNLIVGRNNIGKTMLLEALRLYRTRGTSAALLGLLGVHDEFLRDDFGGRRAPVDLGSLFYRWNVNSPIRLSSQATGDALELVMRRLDAENSDAVEHELVVTFGDESVTSIRTDASLGYLRPSKAAISGPEYHEMILRGGRYAHYGDPFVGPNSLSDRTIARWWDAASLTAAEQRVIECLQIVEPVVRVTLVEHPLGEGRMVLVLREGDPRPLPLRHLGDGMTRVFALALALEQAREGGLLLVDEIENGIHYTGLPRLWRFIFEAATRYGVQVFAATHSWDCVQAFQQAATQSESCRGALIKLFSEGGRVEATVLSEDELAIATRDHIEVR